MKGMKANEHIIYYIFAYAMRTGFVFFFVMVTVGIILTLKQGRLVTVGLTIIALTLTLIQLAIEYALRRYRKNWIAAQSKVRDDSNA